MEGSEINDACKLQVAFIEITMVVQTGASCYNFQSKSIFQKKYASSRYCFDVIMY